MIDFQVKQRPFTANEVYKMAQAGILKEDDRVELIQGALIEMSPIGLKHAACVKRLNRLFSQLGEQVIIGVQDPIHIDEQSEPEPDLVLLQPRTDFYALAHPEPEDVLLLIEVAETSLTYDQTIKLPLYAQANITEVWLVNIVKHQVEVYRQPLGERYQEHLILTKEQSLSPLALPHFFVSASDMLE